MHTKLTKHALIAAVALLFGGTALDAQEKNIVEVASEAGSFSTLLTAATEAGLAETLANGGPFTVFAPTDEAFAKIPEADLEAVLADRGLLRKILLYHVVDGAVSADHVVQRRTIGTLEGSDLPIAVDRGTVRVGGATVVATDVGASNGVIHVIDSVLIPGS